MSSHRASGCNGSRPRRCRSCNSRSEQSHAEGDGELPAEMLSTAAVVSDVRAQTLNPKHCDRYEGLFRITIVDTIITVTIIPTIFFYY